ncbi:MAG: hypothetical protein ACKOET_06695 [Verrucomicrobiota bacterium]
MTFDIQKILESKREFRRGLAALPIGEKLRLLDALRERQLTLGKGSPMRVPASTRPERAITNPMQS